MSIVNRPAKNLSQLLAPRSADGSTVQGSRYPYGDKVLTYLAPGEEVISNRYGQADRHRALLKAINGNRYAAGGTVGNVSVGSPSVSLAGARIVAMFPGVGQVVGQIVDQKFADRDDLAVTMGLNRG